MSAAFEVLAWNDLAAALMEDFSGLAPKDRNLARRAFLGSERADATLYGFPTPPSSGTEWSWSSAPPSPATRRIPR
ncbi:MmyB family transcriptional regulator [Streptomyces acidicola]|uniref:MmyB family transcriptional regulator n=1 Tax=Streptomyces acidicola TaxID=2596892 RepID=UPI00389AFD33